MMRRTVAHAEQIGMDSQPVLPTLPSVPELRATLAAHETQRPDHLKCLHPEAPPALRQMWTDWCDRKTHLETQLRMAEALSENAWKDVTGAPTEPAPWPGHSDVHRMQEKRADPAEKRPNGRPRSDNPSKEALQRRAQRARLREIQGAA